MTDPIRRDESDDKEPPEPAISDDDPPSSPVDSFMGLLRRHLPFCSRPPLPSAPVSNHSTSIPAAPVGSKDIFDEDARNPKPSVVNRSLAVRQQPSPLPPVRHLIPRRPAPAPQSSPANHIPSTWGGGLAVRRHRQPTPIANPRQQVMGFDILPQRNHQVAGEPAVVAVAQPAEPKHYETLQGRNAEATAVGARHGFCYLCGRSGYSNLQEVVEHLKHVHNALIPGLGGPEQEVGESSRGKEPPEAEEAHDNEVLQVEAAVEPPPDPAAVVAAQPLEAEEAHGEVLRVEAAVEPQPDQAADDDDLIFQLDLGPAPRRFCQECGAFFPDEQALEDHLMDDHIVLQAPERG